MGAQARTTERGASGTKKENTAKPILKTGVRIADLNAERKHVQFNDSVEKKGYKVPSDSNLNPYPKGQGVDEKRLPAARKGHLETLVDLAVALRNAKEWAMKLEDPVHTEFG